MAQFFEFDPVKAEKNRQKHGVSFAEAESAFKDPNYLDRYDDDHSSKEDRFVRLAKSDRDRLVVVVYTERTGKRDSFIRIISARLAGARERVAYEKRG